MWGLVGDVGWFGFGFGGELLLGLFIDPEPAGTFCPFGLGRDVLFGG